MPTMLPMEWATMTCVPWMSAFSGGTAINSASASRMNVQRVTDRANASGSPAVPCARRRRATASRSRPTLARITISSMLTMKLIQWIHGDCGRW